MKSLSFFGMIAGIIFLSAFTFNESVSWKIKDGYSIKFTSKDPTGVFTKMDGTIEFDENDLAGSLFDITVEVKSINTGNGMQNRHAVGKKWFQADLYPNIHFKSEKFSKTDNGFEVRGTLDMHGIQKPFTMPFTFENNTFESSFMINRTDFNIGATKGMAAKVPHELKLDISVPVSK